MKKINFLRTSGMILALAVFVQQNCIAQRSAVKCPELPKSTPVNKVERQKEHNYKTIAFSQKEFSKKTQSQRISSRNHQFPSASSMSNPAGFERLTNLTKSEYNQTLVASINQYNLVIIETKNSLLNNSNTERSTISKVAGKDFYIINNPVKNAALQEVTAQKIEGLGLAGMIIGIAGFFIAGIPCGIVATIFGAISLARIKKHPEKFKGKGFAIASLIIGIVVLGLTIAILV